MALTFDDIFTAYYSLFRADSDVPSNTDDEYTVGMRLANEAINYWANYDSTYWNELFTTNQLSNNLGQVYALGTTSYDLPTDFGEIGGYVQLRGLDGTVQARIPRLEPNEVQFRDPVGTYAYIADNKLVLNSASPNNWSGLLIEYPYYKKPTLFTVGASTTEMHDPYFIVHRMLANQFRAARNPYYTSALRDSEDAIRKMQLHNNSGSWDNPPTATDNSGNVWGL